MSVRNEQAMHTPASWIQVLEKRLSLWYQQWQQRFPQSPRSLLARVPSGVLAIGAQGIADVYVPKSRFSLECRPSCVGSSAWILSCVFWICLQIAWLRWTSSRRSICSYPSKNGRCSQIIENSKIGVSRHLDSSTTTQMAYVMVHY